ncbi:uncharacterized protein LOC124110856 isoform X1 [Haliotis rufescens]|uniref:uncharacterized protein LOC124110856 isoform X1 n=1 Tax=Haliotis rufescens TaxID=6454 RepID=UPI001EB0A6F4|nr:uncharacterized protein LOC124110856 isoform X1 [Haliotis rufescens]
MADPSSTAPVRPASSQPSSATTTDTSAIYYDISPTIVFLVRMFNVIVLLMVGIAFILCLIQANTTNKSYYLLACNTVISSFVGVVVNWWYRNGDLGVEKYWYIVLVGVVILIQTITTDIYVFRPEPADMSGLSTAKPVVNGTTRAYTWVTISNVTSNKSLDVYHHTLPAVPVVLDAF